MSWPTATVVDMIGDNVSGADNQQERPGYEQWVVGFVDGKGCFSIPIFRNASTRLGWQVQPEFVVVQGGRSAHVLASWSSSSGVVGSESTDGLTTIGSTCTAGRSGHGLT